MKELKTKPWNSPTEELFVHLSIVKHGEQTETNNSNHKLHGNDIFLPVNENSNLSARTLLYHVFTLDKGNFNNAAILTKN